MVDIKIILGVVLNSIRRIVGLKKFQVNRNLRFGGPDYELCIFFFGFESDHNAAPQLFEIFNLKLIQGV